MTDNPEVHFVSPEIRRPRGSDPGAVTVGAYVIEGDTVNLTDRNGRPVNDGNGKGYSRKIANGDTPKQVAAITTKQMWRSVRGKDRVSGFAGPLKYPPAPKY
jgi:hypothetical protein